MANEIVPIEPNGGADPVEHGIREWQRTREEHASAVERCRIAEQDATFVRGQLEVLSEQKKADTAKISALEAHVGEMQLLVDTLGSAVLSIIEKHRAGLFRRPGSIESGGERLRAAREQSERERREVEAVLEPKPSGGSDRPKRVKTSNISDVLSSLGDDLAEHAKKFSPPDHTAD